MKVLVTGAAGMLGMDLCTELTTRSAIDTVCGLLSEYEETAKTNEPRMQEVAQ